MLNRKNYRNDKFQPLHSSKCSLDDRNKCRQCHVCERLFLHLSHLERRGWRTSKWSEDNPVDEQYTFPRLVFCRWDKLRRPLSARFLLVAATAFRTLQAIVTGGCTSLYSSLILSYFVGYYGGK